MIFIDSESGIPTKEEEVCLHHDTLLSRFPNRTSRLQSNNDDSNAFPLL